MSRKSVAIILSVAVILIAAPAAFAAPDGGALYNTAVQNSLTPG
jgi:hypothetical protein